MTYYHAETSMLIPAPPAQIYAVLSDYAGGHKAILPKPYFTGMDIVEGGHGAGTVVDVHMNVMGTKRSFRMTVSEPEPGRVLAETDTASDVTTQFIIDPREDGTRSHVTIRIKGKTSNGIAGLMERLINPPVMRRIFNEELKLIAAYMQTQAPANAY